MEISRKTDYAIRMLAELIRSDGEIVSVRCAANENHVPYSFARSIQHDLVKTGIVESVRGSRGGMRIAVDPKQMTLLDVVEAVQGPVQIEDQYEVTEGSSLEAELAFIWSGAQKLLKDYLSAVTLYQVVMEGRYPVLEQGCHFVASESQERATLSEE